MDKILVVADRIEELPDLSFLKRYFKIELSKTIIYPSFPLIIVLNKESCIKDTPCFKIHDDIEKFLIEFIKNNVSVESLGVYFNTVPTLEIGYSLLPEVVSAILLNYKEEKPITITAFDIRNNRVLIIAGNIKITIVIVVRISDSKFLRAISLMLDKDANDYFNRLHKYYKEQQNITIVNKDFILGELKKVPILKILLEKGIK